MIPTSLSPPPALAPASVSALADRLAAQLPEWLPLWWWRPIAAVLLVLASVYASRIVVWLAARPVGRRFDRPGLRRTALGGLRAGTVFVALAIAAVILGVRPGDVLLSVTVVSAVIGVVLAPIVRSIFSGLFVLVDKPYEVGDLVEIDGNGEEERTRGFVSEITIRYTKLQTLENTSVVLSNSTVRERDVTNYSADDRRTRLALQLLVPYECNETEARQLVERAARDCEGVIDGGPEIRIGNAHYPSNPTCHVEEYADHGVLLTLRFWTTEPDQELPIRSAVQTKARELLADAGVEFPYPHVHHVFDETSGAAQVEFDEPPASVGADAAGDGSDAIDASDGSGGSEAEPDRRG